MMLDRPLIDSRSEHSYDVEFSICKYHWGIINSAYRRYLISLEDAKTLAVNTAKQCVECQHGKPLDLTPTLV